MKISRKLIVGFLLLIVVAGLYRILPGRPYGFAPQIAMAIFGGAIISEKKIAFLLPVISMFFCDLLFQVLYMQGVTSMPGFYEGQITNYILFSGLTVFGFFIKDFNLKKIAVSAVSAPTTYFLISNFLVWVSPSPLAGLARPKTISGLMMTLADGLPFYPWSVLSTVLFSAILFGSYYFLFEKNMTVRPLRIKI